MNTYNFVRHGESTGNVNGRYSGFFDHSLTVNGVEQALTLKKSLRGMNFGAIYSSPLSRAFHTAIIALGMAIPIFNNDGTFSMQFAQSRKAPITIDSRICERNLGEIDGLTHKEVEEMPKYKGRMPALSFRDKAEGGESFEDLERRVFPFLDSLRSKFRNTNIIIFTHNGPMRLVRKYFEGLTDEQTLNASSPNCNLLSYEV